MSQTSQERNMVHEYLLQLIKDDSKGTMYEDILDKVIEYELANYQATYKLEGIPLLEKYVTEYLRNKHTIVPTEYIETFENKLYMFIEMVSQEFTSDKTAFDICLQLFKPSSILFMMYNEAYLHIKNTSRKYDQSISIMSQLIVDDFYEVIYDSMSNNNGSIELKFAGMTCDESFNRYNRLFIEKELNRAFRKENIADILNRNGIEAEDTTLNRILFATYILNKHQFTAREFVHCYARYGSPIPEFNLTMSVIASINRNSRVPKRN